MSARSVGILAILLAAGAAAALPASAGGADDEAPPAASSPRPYAAMVGLGLGYGSPAGDGHAGEDSGPLVAGDLRLALGATSHLALRYGFQTLDRIHLTIINTIDQTTTEYEGGVDQHQYVVMYGRTSTPQAGRGRIWYWEGGLALTRNKQWEHRATSSEIRGVRTLTRGALATQAGVLLPLAAGGAIGLDINGSLLLEVLGEDSYSLISERSSATYAIQVGCCLALGRP